MEKRLFIAVALSLLILLAWNALFTKPQLTGSQKVMTSPVTETVPAAINPVAAEKEKTLSTVPEGALKLEPVVMPATAFNFPQEKFDVTFIEESAAIKEILFKSYQDYKYVLKNAFLVGENKIFSKEKATDNTVTFIHKDKELLIKKKYIFSNSNYTIGLTLELENISGAPIKIDLPLVLGALDFTPKSVETSYLNVTVATKEKISQENGRKALTLNDAKFVALRDRYFCAIVQSEEPGFSAFVRKVNELESEAGLVLKDVNLVPGQPKVFNFNIYVGPQDLQRINSINREWGAVINYGIFDFFGQMILQTLEFVQRLVKNWGLAIIILSVLVFLVLFPLTLKQMRSMKEMQILAPKVEELRAKYKDNPQKLNQETLALYREHKVNPLGGCLPMLLQMPILFALYQVLMRSVALRGANFLWIKDLSMPDRLLILPFSIPVLGNELNILPILMTIGMFVQQKVSTVSSSSSSAQQQKMMMIIMPVMFLVFFYHLPAGLVLYWVVNSTLMLVYQVKVMRAK
jgi:YidC/Oxa1 family membrane protein insertase